MVGVFLKAKFSGMSSWLFEIPHEICLWVIGALVAEVVACPSTVGRPFVTQRSEVTQHGVITKSSITYPQHFRSFFDISMHAILSLFFWILALGFSLSSQESFAKEGFNFYFFLTIILSYIMALFSGILVYKSFKEAEKEAAPPTTGASTDAEVAPGDVTQTPQNPQIKTINQ